MSPKKFEVFVSREKEPDFVSKMIMKKIGANYSHIGLLIDGHSIYHATGKGFHLQLLSDFEQKKLIVDKIEVSVLNADYALGYLHGNIGKEYSQSQYLGFLLPWLTSLVDNGDEKLICSESVINFLKHCVYDFYHVEPADFVDPKEAFEMVKSYVR